ncbi:MAG: hypothetical protein H7237_02340 [Alkalinema sp. FL-bin-369]|nr:hypothetical protein [Leptolyngbyaceae cyanobacterium LF-bin-369]
MKLPIALPILRLGDRWLYRTGMFLLGFGSSLVMSGLVLGEFQPVLAQVSTTLTNTASGNFRQNPGGPTALVISNSTTVPAQLFVLLRPALEILKTGTAHASKPDAHPRLWRTSVARCNSGNGTKSRRCRRR